MIKRIAGAFAALAMLCAVAAAQTLPSNAIFSPGLVRLAEMEKTRPPVFASMTLDVDEAMLARDLSVLSGMLSGMEIAYSSADGETIRFVRDGQETGVYAVPQSDALDALSGELLGMAALERVPLSSVAGWLEGLQTGDALALGFTVSQPFALERTMSDDGTRLTKIKLSGAIVREGEARYRVEGFMRQPAGRAPKDTFELTFTQDADNTVELLYSALREHTVTRREKEGTASVRTTLKAAGKLGGYGVSSRLTVNMKNRWTADGDALSERITLTASLGHTDRTPGRRMQRLNDLSGENRHVLHLTTHESGDDVIALTDEMTVKLVMDGNTVIDAGAQIEICVGGEAAQDAQAGEPITEKTPMALAKAVYPLLDEKTKQAIGDGL